MTGQGETWGLSPTARRRAPMPAGWHKIRERILARDGGQCVWWEAGVRCPEPATDVDHVFDPEDHSDDNLQALCRRHHLAKTAHQGSMAAKAKRDAARPQPRRHPGLL